MRRRRPTRHSRSKRFTTSRAILVSSVVGSFMLTNISQMNRVQAFWSHLLPPKTKSQQPDTVPSSHRRF